MYEFQQHGGNMKARFITIVMVCMLAVRLVCAQSGVQAEIVISSGLPNTAFPISDSNANILLTDLESLQPASNPNWTWGGWRGFLVENLGALSPTIAQVVVLDGVIREDYSNGSPSAFFADTDNLDVQAFLCQLAGSLFPAGASCLPDAPIGVSQIAGPQPPAVSPWPITWLRDPYNPAFWNAPPQTAFIERKNNCYNYGTARRTNTFQQPGLGHGITLTFPLTCAMVDAGARADGLVPSVCAAACPNATSFKVELVLDQHNYAAGLGLGMDYHWYRQNSSDGLGNTGYFSHKLASNPATNLDSRGNLIPTPDSAGVSREREDLTPARMLQPGYSTSCGCYCVDAVDTHVLFYDLE